MSDRDNVVPMEGTHGHARPLPHGGKVPYGGGGGGGMEVDFRERLAKLEGTTVGYKYALAAVSAALIGGMAILVAVALDVKGDVTDLRGDMSDLRGAVNALPGQINQNLLELSRTLSESITAARSSSDTPQIIVIDRATEATSTPGNQ